MTSDRDHRITAAHRAKGALIYVRQSSQEQVISNTESTKLQVGLREKAIALGWPQPVVIDLDLGVSASGYTERPGFEQILFPVSHDVCDDLAFLSWTGHRLIHSPDNSYFCYAEPTLTAPRVLSGISMTASILSTRSSNTSVV